MIRVSNITDIPKCVEMISEASIDTGLPEAWRKTTDEALSSGHVFLSVQNGTPVGYLAYTTAVLPDTSEFVLIERMLYVMKAYRGGTSALALVKHAYKHATLIGCDAMLAGSSLGNNEAARRVYNHCGFTTNYTFRKDT